MNAKNTTSMANAPEAIPSNILTISSNIFSFLLHQNGTSYDLKAKFLKLKQTRTQHIFKTDMCAKSFSKIEECYRTKLYSFFAVWLHGFQR